jgi:hypothetical protein
MSIARFWCSDSSHYALHVAIQNILSAVKRFTDYETPGELFRASQKDTLKLTVAERIWLIITELIADLSEIFDIDVESLMENLFSENEKIAKYLNFESLSQAG